MASPWRPHEHMDPQRPDMESRPSKSAIFFSEHLAIPPTRPERVQLCDEIDEWFFRNGEQHSLYNSLSRDVGQLIDYLIPLEQSLFDCVLRLQNAPLNSEVPNEKLQQLRNGQDLLETFARLENGYHRFLERLENRFAPTPRDAHWLQENLKWRYNQSRGVDYANAVRNMNNDIEKLLNSKSGRSRATPTTPTDWPNHGRIIEARNYQYPGPLMDQAVEKMRELAKIPPQQGSLELSEEKDPNGTGWLAHPWNEAVVLTGGNATTHAALYVRLNEHNTIIDRLVQKDSCYPNFDSFSNMTLWHGSPPSKTNPSLNVLPKEWYIQALLSAQPDSRFIAGVRGLPYVSYEKLTVRSYIEYCGGGDLTDIIDFYATKREGQDLPEEFILLVFKALVEAGLLMKQGSVHYKRPDWREEIVHRDLKPANIFLEEPARDHFPLYPRPKIADMGHAFFTSEEDESNPAWWNRRAGTPGYRPPEQCCFIDKETEEPFRPWKILSPTNVWGTGVIIYDLMHLNFDQPNRTPNVYLEDDISLTPSILFAPDVLQKYSGWLRRRVMECLFVDPTERPTFEALKKDLDEIFEKNEYLRRGDRGIQEENAQLDLASYSGYEYKIGMASEPEYMEGIEGIGSLRKEFGRKVKI